MLSRRQLRQTGLVILIVGLLAAGAAYEAAQRQEARAQARALAEGDAPDPNLVSDDSKVYNRDSELNMGKSVMLIDHALQSFGQLFHGKNLAFTLATISIVSACGCFAIADRSRSS